MSSYTRLIKAQAAKNQASAHQMAYLSSQHTKPVIGGKLWNLSSTSLHWKYIEPEIIGRFKRQDLFDDFVSCTDLVKNEFGQYPEAFCPYEMESAEDIAVNRVDFEKSVVNAKYAELIQELDQNADDYIVQRAELETDRDEKLQERDDKIFDHQANARKELIIREKLIKEWKEKQSKTFAVFLDTFELDQHHKNMILNNQFRNAWSSLQSIYGGEQKGALQTAMSTMSGLTSFQYIISMNAEANFDYIDTNCAQLELILKFKMPDAMKAMFFLQGVSSSRAHPELKELVKQLQNNSTLANSVESLSWPDVKSSFLVKVRNLLLEKKITIPGDSTTSEANHAAESTTKKRKHESANTATTTAASKKTNNKSSTQGTLWCSHCNKWTYHTIDNCWSSKQCPHCNKTKHNWNTCPENPNRKQLPSEKFANKHGVETTSKDSK